MKSVTDQVLIHQLEKEESPSFQQLYKLYFPSISSYVRRNTGTWEDAEDIFQESLVVLIQKIRQPEFTLTSSLKTYLYAIAKNLWLKRLRDNKIISSIDKEIPDQADTENHPFESDQTESIEEKVQRWLYRITENCQHILKAIFFYQEPMENLIERMGWKNKHTAANQKYKCMEQVKKEIKKES